MTTLDLIEDVAGLERLRPEWNELLRESDADGFFMTPEWLFTWWKHLAQGRRLHVLTVRDGTELIGIAPFTIRPTQIGAHPMFRCFELLGTGLAGSDYLDLVVRPGREELVLATLCDRIAGDSRAFTLRRMRAGSHAERLAGMLAGREWLVTTADDEVAPFVAFGGRSFDKYLADLGSAHRYAFRRRLRGLEKRYHVALERVEQEAERPQALEALITLHGARWKDRPASSEAFSNPALVAFHDEVTRIALERGWLRLYLLRLDGVAAAGLYGFRHRQSFYFYQSGFDPAYAKQSVGLVTMGLVMRAAIEEGIAEFDLLHGTEDYKRHWTRENRALRRADIYPPGVRGWLYRSSAELERQARRFARRAIEAGRRLPLPGTP
jgi:CelD/BcsL family acetyltransferase involved in cellulose biosynthesis